MDNVTVSELASDWLDELHHDMDASLFSAAKARGTAVPYEVAVKDLIEGGAGQPSAIENPSEA